MLPLIHVQVQDVHLDVCEKWKEKPVLPTRHICHVQQLIANPYQSFIVSRVAQITIHSFEGLSEALQHSNMAPVINNKTRK